MKYIEDYLDRVLNEGPFRSAGKYAGMAIGTMLGKYLSMAGIYFGGSYGWELGYKIGAKFEDQADIFLKDCNSKHQTDEEKNKCYIEVYTGLIQSTEQAMRLCNSKKYPEKCKERLDSLLQDYKKRLSEIRKEDMNSYI